MSDPAPDPFSDLSQRIVEVASCANEVESGALSAALGAVGIPHRVVRGGLAGALGELPLGSTTEPKLWTLERYESHARRLIDGLRAGIEEDSPDD